MTPVHADRPRRMPRWLPAVTAIAVALVVAAPGLRNGFAYDDLPLVLENARVTTGHAPWYYFGQSYWPTGELYRPLTVWLMALQWKAGGGAPWLFHVTNVALHALVTGLVYLLARRMLPPPWAGLAAMLFAVHPVHVEAVANVVGLSELLCAAFVLAAVLLAMHGVDGEFTPARRLGVIACGMLAAVSKEQGFVTPALLLVAAGIACVPPGARPLRKVAPVAGALALLLTALLFYRASVLGGIAGDEPAAPLRGLAPTARMLTSLGTVPEWTRLLLWPARLSFDYSPPGHAVASTPGPSHLAALLLLCAFGWIAWTNRRAAPAVPFGIAWAAVALLPVSNLVVPSGVLLAERTLYLASVGAVIAVSGAAWRAATWLTTPAARVAAGVAVSAIVLLAAAKSARRATVWRDNDALLAQVEREAPENYRAHRTLARHLDREGHPEEAVREYRRSMALWAKDPRVHEDLAILLDRLGRDREAIPVLQAGLALDPAAPAMRSKLYFIEAARGEWPAARATAAAGLALGDTMFAALVRRADSALGSPAAPSTSAGK